MFQRRAHTHTSNLILDIHPQIMFQCGMRALFCHQSNYYRATTLFFPSFVSFTVEYAGYCNFDVWCWIFHCIDVMTSCAVAFPQRHSFFLCYIGILQVIENEMGSFWYSFCQLLLFSFWSAGTFATISISSHSEYYAMYMKCMHEMGICVVSVVYVVCVHDRWLLEV